MMHKGMLWLAVAAVVGTLMLASPARAQETEKQGFTVSAGVFYPYRQRHRAEPPRTCGSISTSPIPSRPASRPSRATTMIWGHWWGSTALSDNRVIPVGLSFTGHLNEQFFYRATAGIGFSSNGDSETGFAWSLGFGYNFNAGTTPIALFIGYNGLSARGGDFNGFTATLQFRF
jgi:hypothetical protein